MVKEAFKERADLVAKDFVRCQKWIEDALKYSNGTYSTNDVFYAIIEDSMQLWSGDQGCIVTQIVTYPQKKVLYIFLAGGKMEQLFDLESEITSWAIKQGCQATEFSGRKGWLKPLTKKGWHHTSVTMIKEI
jgi:hypothetical protein